jgi:2-oxoglutarate ferredoxin oxidoreductase subunit alpha
LNGVPLEPAKLVPVLHFGGTPITARFVAAAVAEGVAASKVVPFRKSVS